MGGPTARDPLLGQIVAHLVRALQPAEIYLFGSRAKANAAPSADYDILVVVEDSDLPNYRRDQAALRALRDVRAAVDVIVLTRREFDEALRAPTSLPSTVRREGVRLDAA